MPGRPLAAPSVPAGTVSGMPQFSDLARPILIAISTLSGDDYRDVDDSEIISELRQRGYEPSDAALERALQRLMNDGYITAYFRAGGAATMIRLDANGRKEVEDWPAAPGTVSSGDVEQLVVALRSRADDVALPEADRNKARAAADAIKDLGVQVTAAVIGSWLKSIGIG